MTTNNDVDVKIFVRPPEECGGAWCHPQYSSEHPGAFDLLAAISRPMVLYAGEILAIPLGIVAEVPVGYALELLPRSGLAARYGVTLINSPGLVDSDYRGEIMALVTRHKGGALSPAGNQLHPIMINPGDRICQGRVVPVYRARFHVVDTVRQLSETERGAGGLGSTGIATPLAAGDQPA